MNDLEKFWESVKKEEIAFLATSAGGNVTMRTVSPVYYEDAILLFTRTDAQKYTHLKENPNCCISVGRVFMEAKAEFLGHTMLDENKALRDIYEEKFAGAFDEGIDYGGRDSEFILLKPTRIRGWGYEDGVPTGAFDYKF